MEKNDSRWLTSEAQAVEKVLNDIDKAELRGSRELRGDIAILRRIAGRMPNEDAKSTATAIRLLSSHGLPLRDDCYVGDDGLTVGERAAVIALALSASTARLAHSHDGKTFGAAFAEAVRSNENLEPILKTITYDEDLNSLTYNLFRALRQFGDVKLDYGQLTNDLIRFQNPDKRETVLIRWVKDYYQVKNTPTHKE